MKFGIREFEIREIVHGSAAYEQEVALRRQILREPLGLQFSSEELSKEISDLHLGAFVGDRLVGCLVLTPLGETKIKMRQVAVDANAQGLGIGRLLVEASERKVRERGFSELELNARETAVPFYLKLGYEIIGDPFTDVSIPHRKMWKALHAASA